MAHLPRVPHFRKRHPPVGSRPGTLVAPEGSPPPKIRVIRYGPEGVEEFDVQDTNDLKSIDRPNQISWVDVQGLGDEAVLRSIADTFGIHALTLEDIVNAPQRPKAEEFDRHLFLITRMASLKSSRVTEVEQVSVLVGETFVLSVQESYGDCLDPVRQRIRDGRGRIRTSDTTYLGYALVDTIIDGYYPIIDALSAKLVRLEDIMLVNSSPAVLHRLNQVRTDLVVLRRGVWPQQETIARLLREQSRFVPDSIRPYLRDTLDHCSQLVDVIDSHRELVNGLMNTYLSVSSNRTNDVMKVLTIMASIFIPLTFIAGIYGMNFDHMPELHKKWAYPAALALMATLAIGMLIFFRRKGWLGGDGADAMGDDD